MTVQLTQKLLSTFPTNHRHLVGLAGSFATIITVCYVTYVNEWHPKLTILARQSILDITNKVAGPELFVISRTTKGMWFGNSTDAKIRDITRFRSFGNLYKIVHFMKPAALILKLLLLLIGSRRQLIQFVMVYLIQGALRPH